MNNMFSYCLSLITLPDILNWNVSKVKDMCQMLLEDNTLRSFSDLSKWNILKVKDISQMFLEVNALRPFLDLSKWDTLKVKVCVAYLMFVYL